ncbi:unnamed protein product [Gongylonema pulchrum]|uniref:TIMELESS domain-containing protein n=1 Tax=Gongylonema pulchrum TaxID=637853 RepID=A0A183E0I3_9BILA|nr:unnamed protein product [Gongylonema pulchrum]
MPRLVVQGSFCNFLPPFRHDPLAFLKVGETLAFLVRDAAHITPDNFDSCVECLRSYTEASLDGGRYAAGPLSGDAQSQLRSVKKEEKSRRTSKQERESRKQMSLNAQSSAEIDKKTSSQAEPQQLSAKRESRKQMSLNAQSSAEIDEKTSSQAEPQQLSASYLQVAFQMLDLCHTLHVKGAAIYYSWAEGDTERAFLIPEMQVMHGKQWEQCFGEVLFPLLQKLLENLSPMDPIGMEETRVRATQLVSKILLNHLTLYQKFELYKQSKILFKISLVSNI